MPAEVAFEHRPAPGFFDVGEENARTKEIGLQFRPTTIEEMEGRRRKVRPLCLCCGQVLRNLTLHTDSICVKERCLGTEHGRVSLVFAALCKQ